MTIRPCECCGTEIPSTRRADAACCSDKCGNRLRVKRWATSNPDRVKRHRWKTNSDVPRRIHSRVKSRAKMNGTPFDLDPSDIVIPSHCPVLGIKLEPQAGKGSGYHDNSPSLDRIVPALGYVRGNVRVISGRANLLKSNASSAELELVVADLKGLGQ